MSKVNENQTEELVKEVNMETENTQELAVVEEKKKFNLNPKLKTALKWTGVAGLGLLSFVLGAKWNDRKHNDFDNEENEDVDYEVVDESEE